MNPAALDHRLHANDPSSWRFRRGRSQRRSSVTTGKRHPGTHQPCGTTLEPNRLGLRLPTVSGRILDWGRRCRLRLLRDWSWNYLIQTVSTAMQLAGHLPDQDQHNRRLQRRRTKRPDRQHIIDSPNAPHHPIARVDERWRLTSSASCWAVVVGVGMVRTTTSRRVRRLGLGRGRRRVGVWLVGGPVIRRVLGRRRCR